MTPSSILITGASRGLGLQFVKHILSLPQPPKFLIATCRNPAKADELQQIAELHSCVKIAQLDVTRDDQIANVFEQTATLVGDDGLNLLINNAGVSEKSGGGFLETQTREKLQSHFDTNVSGPVLITQKFLPLLKKAAEANSTQPLGYGRAAVVNISSIMGSIASTMQSQGSNVYHYRSSKAALNMATALMALELRPFGILVAGLHPGWVRTELGGPQAMLDAETSIAHCWSVIKGMSTESSGLLYSYDGTVLPW